MNIIIYGKPGCGICESAKKKLEMFGLPYEYREMEQYTVYHEGWREDGSEDVLAAYSYRDHKMPLLKIDDQWFDYPGAMKYLKGKM